MKNNVLNFYLLANKLKEVVRTGWKEVKISRERIESVADHIYGCMVLTIGLDSEHDLGLNIEKVFKMLVVKELEKVELDKEFTSREYSTYEERRNNAFKTVSKVTEGLLKQQELMDLLEESYQKETKEAKFVNQISKLESDIQAKIYDLSGDFKLENALEDAKYYGEELSNEIIPQMKNASDGWILYDRKSYTDEIFKFLSEDIQNLEE